jgi:hypothetical protein
MLRIFEVDEDSELPAEALAATTFDQDAADLLEEEDVSDEVDEPSNEPRGDMA